MLHRNPLLFLAQARHNVGLIEEARELYQTALESTPDDPTIIRHLARLEIEDGHHEVALALFGRALDMAVDDPEFLFGYAIALMNSGHDDQAIMRLRQVLEHDPAHKEAGFLLGAVLQRQGDSQTALDIFTRFLELYPDDIQLRMGRAGCLSNVGLNGTASAEFYAILEMEPGHVDAHFQLGATSRIEGNLAQAIIWFERTLELAPERTDAMLRLADAHLSAGRPEVGIEVLKRAIAIEPESTDLNAMLGICYAAAKDLDNSIEAYHRTLELTPDNVATLNNLGLGYISLGRSDEAVECFRRALEITPVSNETAAIASNLYFAAHYQLDITPQELLEMQLTFENHLQVRPKGAPYIHKNKPDRDRPLRVGYVSYDFMQHPVGFFVSSVIVRHDPSQVISYCYSTRAHEDRITWFIKANTKHWRRVVGVKPAAFAALIEDDEIDILIDLGGHTAGNHLPVFALKPAPVQATWAGYIGTTGLSTMDYLIADRYQVPPEFDQFHSETTIRLPHDYICYEPPTFAPAVGPLPVLRNGHIIFGCFSNPAKINDRELGVWAKILHQVPGSVLRLRYANMTVKLNADRIHGGFARHGIEAERVWLEPGGSGGSMFEGYNNVDIGLDTFPYSGGLTTCEAMWMGVPVVTCPGNRFESRHCFSHLSNAGLTETIAWTFDDYVRIAVELANDIPRLSQLRGTLRARMASSPLCDSDGFARDLETAYRGMWHRWCDSQES